MKLLFILCLLLTQFFALQTEEPDFFESERFQEIKARYCSPPKFCKNRKETSLDLLKNELNKGSDCNPKEVVRLCQATTQNDPYFRATIDNDFLTFKYFNFNKLTDEEKKLFVSIMVANEVCNDPSAICIDAQGCCRIKMEKNPIDDKIYSLVLAEEYKEKVKKAKSLVEAEAYDAAIYNAGSLLTASTVCACLLAIEALKTQAQNQCESDPDNWWAIVQPLRNFTIGALDRKERYE